MSYNILSLDGGGIRGIILLKQLIELENQLDDKICNKFDLISGTSTGGIIAVLLAKGYTAKNILDFYLDNSKKIFNKRFLRFGLIRSKYSDKNFNRLLKEYLGELTLSDLKCDVIIPTYNINKKSKYLFKSSKDKNASLYDVVRSTASPQSFFPIHKIDHEYFIDGGMVINNPSLVSYSEAVNLGYKKINLISFSTGHKESNFRKFLIKAGILFWAKPTLDILLMEQSKMTDFHMSSISNNNKNINYIRCNSIIDKSNGKIDDASQKNITNMLLDGQNSTELNFNKIKEFIKLLK
jgi:uncharacterized protein